MNVVLLLLAYMFMCLRKRHGEVFFDSLVALFGISNCRYANRDRLSPEHERTIVEMLLPYHPEFEKKIGCGIDYIMVCIMLF